jgi:hypothetical protein
MLAAVTVVWAAISVPQSQVIPEGVGPVNPVFE